MPARMPAQVHELLLARGLIPDPHVGNNAAASAWVGEKDWAYLCRFPTPDRISGPVFIRFEGLDTVADVFLNGAALGHFDNMFREYAVEVKNCLAPAGQQNTLIIVFSSPLRFMRAARVPPNGPDSAEHKSLRIRRAGTWQAAAPKPHPARPPSRFRFRSRDCGGPGCTVHRTSTR
jgi:hypothetical protein